MPLLQMTKIASSAKSYASVGSLMDSAQATSLRPRSPSSDRTDKNTAGLIGSAICCLRIPPLVFRAGELENLGVVSADFPLFSEPAQYSVEVGVARALHRATAKPLHRHGPIPMVCAVQ